MFQLRWYGYCLFRALASLHKRVCLTDVALVNCLFLDVLFLFVDG
jgi:hypothetical protein